MEEPTREIPDVEATAVGKPIVLRVHGAGGSPPEEILGSSTVVRVSGDDTAGFYRVSEDAAEEAFYWGGLTSRAAQTALTVVLLPFALANASGYQNLAGDSARRSRLVSRLFALNLTVIVALGLGHLSLDLIAVQCWALAECANEQGFLAVGGRFVGDAGVAMAWAALIPVAVLTILWFSGRPSWRRFEGFIRSGAGMGSGESDPPATDLDFWRGALVVRRLRGIHFAVAIATLALATTLSTNGRDGWHDVLRVVALVASLAIMAECVIRIVTPAIHANQLHWSDSRSVRWASAGFVAGTLALSMWVAGRSTPDLGGDGLFGFALIGYTVVGVTAALLIAIAVVNRGRSFLGTGGFTTALVAWLLAISVWSGLGLAIDRWLGPDSYDMRLPPWFEHATVAYLVFIAALAGGVIMTYLQVKDEGDDAQMDVDHPESAAEPSRRRSVTRMFRLPRLVERADGLLAGSALIALAVGLAGVAVDWAPEVFAWLSSGALDPPASVRAFLVGGESVLRSLFPETYPGWLTWLASWAAIGLPIVTFLAVRWALGRPGGRRVLGWLSDILAVFPRRIHPFAPPCYAERAVPQLAWRLERLTSDLAEGVVVRAHSQGTVVTALALRQLAAEGIDPGCVALVTYGSPLAILHKRVFPELFGEFEDTIGADLKLGDTVRWRHFWVATDPLGAPMQVAGGPAFALSAPHNMFKPHDVPEPAPDLAGLSQVRVRDPAEWYAPDGDAPVPVRSHSAYHFHPSVQDTVDAMVEEMGACADASAPEPDDDASPPQPTDVVVPARAWRVRSGIRLDPAKTYVISADGSWSDWGHESDAGGAERREWYMLLAKRLTTLPAADWLQLCAEVVLSDGSTRRLRIGTEATLTHVGGELYFFGNDVGFMRWNNTGRLTVTVAETAPGEESQATDA